MPLVELLEGRHVALSGPLGQRVICFLLRLGFGCGHVFLIGQATKLIANIVVRRQHHDPAFQR